MKKYLSSLLFFVLAALFLYVGVTQGGNTLIGGAAFAAIFVFLGIRRLVKYSGQKPAEASRPAAAPSPKQAAPEPAQQYNFVNFSVAGVTFKNDDGSDRQTILRHIHFQDAPYVTDGSADVEIQSYDYQGSPAFRVLVNGYQIGNVPKDKIPDVQNAVDHGAEVSGFHVTGGGSVNGKKINYGCEIALRWPVS